MDTIKQNKLTIQTINTNSDEKLEKAINDFVKALIESKEESLAKKLNLPY